MNQNITLRQLRAFLAVAEHGSFTKAAAVLNITQSALTTAVKNLETEVGLRLFDRTTRQVEPTAYGRQFAVLARRFTEDLERGMDDLRAHVDRQQGLVVVGATATMITSVLVPALKEMSERFPGIRVRIIEVLTAEAIEHVRRGDMDMAFTTVALPDADFDAVPVMRDVFDLVCPPSHRLAREDGPLSWDVFRNHPTIGMSGESGLRGILMGHEAGQAAAAQLAYEVSSVWGLTRMVREGLGIAAVPSLIAQEMATEGIRRIRLAPPVYRTVSLITRSGRSPTPAAATLVAAALSRLRDLECDGIEIPVTDAQLAERGFGVD